MTEDIFGPIFVGRQIEDAALETLRTWMPTYLQEIELQLQRVRGEIPAPRLYTTRNEFTQFPEDQMPMCVVVSPGLVSEPKREGDGTYNAWFALAVGFAAAGRDADTSRFLAQVYGAAGRAILLHKSSLGGVASGVEWTDESYDNLVTEDDRVVRACYNMYQFHVAGIVQKGMGPAVTIPDPVEQPGSQWPSAETIEIDVEAVE